MQEAEERENGIFFCMNSLRIIGIHKGLATAYAEVQGNVEDDKKTETPSISWQFFCFHG